MPSPNETRMRDAYYGDIDRTGRVGNRLLGSAAGGLENFSPDGAFQRRLQAAQSQFARDFDRRVGDLRGSQVASGRVNTGFGFQDQDRLFGDMSRYFAETAGNAALQTTGMDLDRLRLMSSLGGGLSSEALAARGGEYQTLRQQRLEEAASKRNFWGGLLGSLIGGAGSYFGGK